MADPDYRLFSPDPDNNTASPPVGAPEGSYLGKYVNDTLRFLMSALRRLGDSTLKIDVDSPTGGLTGDSVAGLMAVKDNLVAADIAGLPGTVPVGAMLPFWGTLTAAVALQPLGWLVCDGRTATIAGTVYAAPDLRLAYLRMFGTGVDPQSQGGDLLTSYISPFAPGDTAGAHALTMAELPAELLTDAFGDVGHGGVFQSGGNARILQDANVGGGQGHTHPLPTTTHNHAVDPPPFAAVIPLLRVF